MPYRERRRYGYKSYPRKSGTTGGVRLMLSRYFAEEEYVARKRRVLAEMEKRGCATAVIFGRGAGTHEHHGDLLYLTNYYSSASGQEPDNALLNARSFSAVILRKNADAELHADIPGLREDLVVIDRFE